MSLFALPNPARPPAGGLRAQPLRRAALFAIACALIAMLALPAGASAKKKHRRHHPMIPPAMIGAVTEDRNHDGRVDAILLTYNVKVKHGKVKKGGGHASRRRHKKRKARPNFTVAGHKVISVRVQHDRKHVLLTITEGPAVNTAERPIVVYKRARKRKKGIVDRKGSQAFAGLIRAKDGLAPLFYSAKTVDANGNGKVDGVQLTYSEPLKAAAAGAISVPGFAVTGATVSGATVDATVAEVGYDTDARPAVSALPGAATDASGNPQDAAGTVVAADGAPPAIIAAKTEDRDGDGKLDRVVVTFSEPIQHQVETIGASLQVAGFSNTAASAPVNGSDIDIDFNEGGSANTGARPAVNLSAGGAPIADASGNVAAPTNFTQTTDGAPPVLIAAKLKDTTADGRIDSVAATFSEPVSYLPVVGDFTTTASSSALGNLTASGITQGAVVNLAISPVSACCNTDLPTVLTPVPITYVPPGGAGGVSDAAGQAAAAATVSATDGAGPVVTSAETEDANGDGFIDHMYIGFSESVAQLAGQPFNIAGGGRTVDTANGNAPAIVASGPHSGEIQITLVPRAIDDTGDRPTVDYKPSGIGAYVKDALGNETPVTSTPFAGTADGAPPVIRAAYTSDTNSDGHVDRITTVWSEPVMTDSAPAFQVIPQNPPSGYASPTVAGGATAVGQTVTVPLTPSTDADRDVKFTIRYNGGANANVMDASANANAAIGPQTYNEQGALCNDDEEASGGTQDDDAAHAKAGAGYLTGDNARHLATLCGGDQDNYAIAATSGQEVKVLFSPTDSAFSLTGRDGAYDPFTVSGPGSPTSSVSFTASLGWTVDFTAPSDGTYVVGVQDTNTPVADYGYCIALGLGGNAPTCNVRQGDLAITELLKDPIGSDPTIGQYVEVKNVSPIALQSADIAALQLNIGSVSCDLTLRGNTPATIGSGQYFLISTLNFPGTDHDFDCPGMAPVDYDAAISLSSPEGTIDSLNFGNVSAPAHLSLQVRSGTSYETSTGNDDAVNGWCASIDYGGTPAAANPPCDQFRLEEAMFMPSNATRDGRVYIELRGNAPVVTGSPLLAGWQIRVRAQSGVENTYLLPSTAAPNSQGFYVLADQPNGGGDTYVPFYSDEVPTLDTYLTANQPATISLLKPGADCATGTPVDTVGYVPGIVGVMTAADTVGNCLGYLVQPVKAATGFQSSDTLQRNPFAAYSGNNMYDWCAHTPATPMAINPICGTIQ